MTDGRWRRLGTVAIVIIVVAAVFAVQRAVIEFSVRRHETVRAVEQLASDEGWVLVRTESAPTWLLPLAIAGIGDDPIVRTVVYETGTGAATTGAAVEVALLGGPWPEDATTPPATMGLEWRSEDAAPALARAQQDGVVGPLDLAAAGSIVGYHDPTWLSRLDTVRIEVADGAIAVSARGGTRSAAHVRTGGPGPPSWRR